MGVARAGIMCDFELVTIDDGHKPGRTTKPTQLAVNAKPISKFCSIFDDLLPSSWRERAYEYSKQRVKPWGKLLDLIPTI